MKTKIHDRPRFKVNDHVIYVSILCKITKVKKGFTGWEYDLESVLPNRSNHQFMTTQQVPEGFLTKTKRIL